MRRPSSPSPPASDPALQRSQLPHSFQLILYLEWILLGLAFLLTIRPARFGMNPAAQMGVILILMGFGLMGLYLPTRRMGSKILYTAVELLLLVITFWIDRRTGSFPLLGIIIAIRSCLIFQQTGRLIVAGLVFVSSVLLLFFGMPPPPPRRHEGSAESIANTIFTLNLNTAITFGLTLLFILLLVNALLAERQSREKLLQANDQLRQYALRIEDQATLQERNRIAREIHDALGHTLTAQSIQLENALLFLPAEAEKTRSFLQESQHLGKRALQEVRRSIATLRSNPLQGRSLPEAIEASLSEFQSTTGILTHHSIQAPPLAADISTALYRILQESLTNISKHSTATQVSLSLLEHHHTLILEITDNGQGFDPEQNTTGFGIQGMRERTATLGGQFTLSSQPGQGCGITISIPLPQS
jgi:signal transduction histidine kinase